jgi:serine/threonine protein kinase
LFESFEKWTFLIFLIYIVFCSQSCQNYFTFYSQIEYNSLSGAFGHAVLYRRHMDNQMVVIKEVHIAELGATERQLALNEVQVLASLNHPNIIRFALHE